MANNWKKMTSGRVLTDFYNVKNKKSISIVKPLNKKGYTVLLNNKVIKKSSSKPNAMKFAKLYMKK